MIVIKIMGGFASQFNKYALGYSIAQYLNKELILDLSDYSRGYFRPYSLCYLRLPNYRIITDKEVKKVVPGIVEVRNSKDMFDMIKKSKKKNFWINREEEDYRDFLDTNKGFEIGKDAAALQFLEFNESIKSKFVQIFKKNIEAEWAVAIHVRRGDYVTLGWNDDMEFYKAAIAKFTEESPNYHFYFFSNDLEWTKEYFGKNDKFHYVSAIKGNLGDVEELFCMANCKYRILSRFSGYGMLANILASKQYKDSYALMNGSGKYENQSQLSQEMMEIYQNVADGRIIEHEKGGIYYLQAKEIEAYIKKYSLYKSNEALLPLSENITSLERERELDNKGIDISKPKENSINELIKIRAMTYRKDLEIDSLRECLESINWQYSKEETSDWETIYNIPLKKEHSICLLTSEVKNCWRIEGFYLLALMLSRLGYKVEYHNSNENVSNTERKMYQASNIDGKSYPFLIYEGYDTKEKTVLAHDIVIIDSIHLLNLYHIKTTNIFYVKDTDKKEIFNFKQFLIQLKVKNNLSRGYVKLLTLPSMQKFEYSNEIKSPYDFFVKKEEKWANILHDIF